MTADPRPFEFTQPDGSKVWLRLRGDEFFDWTEDMEGFTVMRDGDKFVYATLSRSGDLVRTRGEAGKVDPRALDLQPGVLPPPSKRGVNLNGAHKPYRPWARAAAQQPDIAPSGTVRNLVILCMFSDHTLASDTRPREDYETLFNRIGSDPAIAPTGSVRDAFRENSYGILDLQSTVVAWVTLPQTQAYYAGVNNGRPFGANPSVYPNNAARMVEDALALADAAVNFADFDQDNDGYIDAIAVIHSAYGAEQAGAPPNSIWSHKWVLPSDWTSAESNGNGVRIKVRDYHTVSALWGSSGTAITRIGVIVHETGHFFGLPDLYDTNTPRDSRGLGAWCMMANSWGFDNSQLRPPHFSAWCKKFLQWVQPALLAAPGTYALRQAETFPEAIQIMHGFPPGEYLLIENRQPVGLDSDIPQGGLAIWHVDENVANNDTQGFPGQPDWPDNGNHYRVALLQADGRYDLERNANEGDAADLYHSMSSVALGLNTNPSADAYQRGIICPSYNVLSKITAAGSTMYFDYAAPPSLYVNSDYTGAVQDGSCERPYRKLSDAYAAANNGDTIVIRAGQLSESPLGLLDNNKRVFINSHRGVATVR